MIDVKELDRDQCVFVLSGLWKKYVPTEDVSQFWNFSDTALQWLLDMVLTQDKQAREKKFHEIEKNMNADIQDLKEFCGKTHYFTIQVKEERENKTNEEDLHKIEDILQQI